MLFNRQFSYHECTEMILKKKYKYYNRIALLCIQYQHNIDKIPATDMYNNFYFIMVKKC